MKHPRIVTILAALALGGCAATENAELAAHAAARNDAPTCTAGPDCTAKWDAAQLWLVKNSRFKMQMTTSVVLQTMGPSQADRLAVATTVTREPAGGDQYRIVADMRCVALPQHCLPSLSKQLADFNRTVSAAKP